jgi:hypothetical protein
MLRQAFLALTMSLVVGMPAVAGPIGFGSGTSPYGPLYSASSSPFEAFEWTPLDFAAFSAYGGDFANVRRPVTPIYFVEELGPPPAPPGPDDEQAFMRQFNVPTFEELPSMSAMTFDAMSRTEPIPEPGALMLIGLGLLGASTRLRRAYRNR